MCSKIEKKPAALELLHSPGMISRKIWVTENPEMSTDQFRFPKLYTEYLPSLYEILIFGNQFEDSYHNYWGSYIHIAYPFIMS